MRRKKNLNNFSTIISSNASNIFNKNNNCGKALIAESYRIINYNAEHSEGSLKTTLDWEK